MSIERTSAPKRTPWGVWDHCKKLADGIFTVGTPRHGGIFVDDEVNQLIPPYARAESGWYEEDCDWAIPFAFLGDRIREHADQYALNSLSHCEETLKNWNWEIFEKKNNVILAPGQSQMKDRTRWHKDHAGELEVTSAMGHPLPSYIKDVDHESVPPDHVLIWARPIPERIFGGSNGEERMYVATKEAYHAARSKCTCGPLVSSIEGVRELSKAA